MKVKNQLAKISKSDLAMLGWYNSARTALEKAYRIDEVKAVKDKAVAVRLYALQAGDKALQSQATEISLRAEIRGGELLAEIEKGANRFTHTGKPSPYKEVLDEAGVSY